MTYGLECDHLDERLYKSIRHFNRHHHGDHEMIH